ncbi:hypothetical protein GS399_05500 [Pedobacter sp. HMF7647]|uniref:Uncharacterized protein n=1 Tax=Hufsiella arboris TaxID=2695275 RepID=A0A7K1Y7R7_9SPHI|nr:hypothetical protein [Hufsiella arboris]MXV50421.1 hypothetical protein [Hufsiella arboris]
MKNKHLWMLCLSGLILNSCQKNQSLTRPLSQKKYPVTFRVDGFGVEVKHIGTTKNQNTVSGLRDQIKYLTYSVWEEYSPHYDSLVHEITQTADNPNFGTIADSLPDRKFKITFVASDKDDYAVTLVTGRATSFIIPTFNFRTVYGGDIFYRAIGEFTPSSAETQHFTLTRAVSKIGVKIKDELPVNAVKAVITFADEGLGFDLLGDGANTYPGVENERRVPFAIKDEDKGKSNVQFSTYIYGNKRYYLIKLALYDASNNLIVDKAIVSTDTLYKINTEYIYTGYLMPQSNTSFTVAVNDTWSTPVNVGF